MRHARRSFTSIVTLGALAAAGALAAPAVAAPLAPTVHQSPYAATDPSPPTAAGTWRHEPRLRPATSPSLSAARKQPAPATSWQAAWDGGSASALRSWFVANTGPTVRLTKATRGVYTVASQAAADALVGRTVTGRVSITASGVRLRDFKVVNDGSGQHAVGIAGGLTGVVLEDFEVDGRSHLTTLAAVGGGSWANVTVRRAHIHHSLDGVRLFEGSTYEHLFVEDATPNAGYVSGSSTQHADAVQVVRAGAGKPITVRRSWLDHSAAGPNVTSVAMIVPDAGQVEGVTIEESFLNGGRYTVTVQAGPHGAPRGIAIRNNRFGRDFQYGVWSGSGVAEGADYDRTGNVWADTLQPATLTWGLLTTRP